MIRLYLVQHNTDVGLTIWPEKNIRWFPSLTEAWHALGDQSPGAVLIWNHPSPPPSGDKLCDLVPSLDFAHVGLLLRGQDLLTSTSLVTYDWRFLNGDPTRRCVSWRATPDVALIHPRVWQDLGGFDTAYASLQGQVMDLAFRALKHGGRVWHCPELISGMQTEHPKPSLPAQDQLIFFLRHFGFKNTAYALFWMLLLNPRSTLDTLQAYRKALVAVRRKIPPLVSSELRLWFRQPRTAAINQRRTTVSAIIPTIGRYDYLEKALASLQRQTHPLHEVIVVDQNPPAERDKAPYSLFPNLKLRVIYLDRPGQSTARNTAIASATGEWLFFFDDDSEAQPDVVQTHLEGVLKYGVDASTGISMTPWGDRSNVLPQASYRRIADTLETGNALIRRTVVVEVGAFDPAFDRGVNADSDLGTRLFLAGYENMLNPEPSPMHHKAPYGGLRTHGAWWRETSESLLGAFPPPTQVYFLRRYLPRPARAAQYVRLFLQARRRNPLGTWLLMLLLAPVKLFRARRAADLLAKSTR